MLSPLLAQVAHNIRESRNARRPARHAVAEITIRRVAGEAGGEIGRGGELTMPNQGTESQFEATTIDRLLALPGYRYQYGGEIERDLRDVVMTDWLRAFLQKKYPHLPADALEEAIVKASRPEGVTTGTAEQEFSRAAHARVRAEIPQAGRHGSLRAYLRRRLGEAGRRMISAWSTSCPFAAQNDRRPDIIIYLNGFPIVLFELKNPYEEQPNTLGAFNQVQHYKAGISQLFDYNALVVVSDGGMVGHADDDTPHAVGSTLHGMWTAPWEWFAPWKSINGRDVVESSTGAMKTLIEGLFPAERLLDYIRHFIAFEVRERQRSRRRARSITSISACVSRWRRPSAPRDRTATGKSASSGTRKVRANRFRWRISSASCGTTRAWKIPRSSFRWTARTLTTSCTISLSRSRRWLATCNTPGPSSNFARCCPAKAARSFSRPSRSFSWAKRKVVHPTLSTRRNLIVIADEAHRSQYGLTEGFAHQLRKALPNASFIGFTGTPISFASAGHAGGLWQCHSQLRHAPIEKRPFDGADLLRAATGQAGTGKRTD